MTALGLSMSREVLSRTTVTVMKLSMSRDTIGTMGIGSSVDNPVTKVPLIDRDLGAQPNQKCWRSGSMGRAASSGNLGSGVRISQKSALRDRHPMRWNRNAKA